MIVPQIHVLHLDVILRKGMQINMPTRSLYSPRQRPIITSLCPAAYWNCWTCTFSCAASMPFAIQIKFSAHHNLKSTTYRRLLENKELAIPDVEESTDPSTICRHASQNCRKAHPCEIEKNSSTHSPRHARRILAAELQTQIRSLVLRRRAPDEITQLLDLLYPS